MDLICDNNVFLDYVLRREPFQADAASLVGAAAFGDVRLCVTTAMLTDLFYILRKHFGSKDAQERIETLLEFFDVCGVSEDVAREALSLKWADFEDCLIACCAKRRNSDYIVTRNEKDFANSQVKAVSPAFILEKLAAQGKTYGEVELS